MIKWVTDHRKHHDFADEDGDPHSPHEAGGLGALKGLWHAHAGWLFTTVGQADRRRYGADLLKDRGIRVIDAAEKPLIAGEPAAPVPARAPDQGHADRRPRDAGLGRPGADLPAPPRHVQHQLDLPLLRSPSLRDRRRVHQRRAGSRSPPSASRGTTTTTPFRPRPSTVCARRELDIGGQFIRALERLGLAWDVVRVSPERQQRRIAAAAAGPHSGAALRS